MTIFDYMHMSMIFSIDYGTIDVADFFDIDKYLIKKYGIKQSLDLVKRNLLDYYEFAQWDLLVSHH